MKKTILALLMSILTLNVFSQTSNYYIEIVNNDFNNDSCGIINMTINPAANYTACGVVVNGVGVKKSVTYPFTMTADRIFNFTLHFETTCGCVYDFVISDTVLFVPNTTYARVIFADGDDCNDSSTFVLGIDELETITVLTVYPNPANSQITLSRIGDVLIYSSNGKLVKNVRNDKVIDVTDLPSGLYLGFINGEKFNFIKN
jgi:hypothetical protein